MQHRLSGQLHLYHSSARTWHLWVHQLAFLSCCYFICKRRHLSWWQILRSNGQPFQQRHRATETVGSCLHLVLSWRVIQLFREWRDQLAMLARPGFGGGSLAWIEKWTPNFKPSLFGSFMAISWLMKMECALWSYKYCQCSLSTSCLNCSSHFVLDQIMWWNSSKAYP